ncbi:MAG: NYN domain-containing protein [Thermoanaerobaculales bacterium]|nr:NYN domain-containing protein [Thermoanaerobaculales bacterium]
MPILIDGNNLLHTLPRSHRDRESVRRLIIEQTRHERISVTVVFDGPPPDGSPATEHLGQVTVLYSGQTSADDVIIGRLPSSDAARSWSVVTNDRGLAARVRERGASTRTLAQWIGRRGVKVRPGKPRPKPPLRAKEVEQWEEEFTKGKETEDDGHARVFRRRRKVKS